MCAKLMGILLTILSILLSVLEKCFSQQSLTITIQQGTLLGTTGINLDNDPFLKFLGIPYAKPPLGSLRFKAPVPPESWVGVKNATVDGNISMQVDPHTLNVTGSEDCLYLNVFTQRLPGNGTKLRPVMVHFHAGAFSYGSGTQAMLKPEYLLTEDIVLVTVNYRLGIFGFLSLVNASLDVPGNAGLKDQVQALKWVQENIKNFNGDPSQVTIFGISAGGVSVQHLLLSASAKGLFHRAIASSGTVLNPWAWGRKNAVSLAQNLDPAVLTEAKALEVLMSASGDEIFNASLRFPSIIEHTNIRKPFGPVIETPNPTAFLTEDPVELWKSGKINDVPLIQGVCSNDGLILAYENPKPVVDPLENGIPWTLKRRGPKEVEKITAALQEFYSKDGVIDDAGLYKLLADVMFVEGALRSLKMHLNVTKHSVYFFVFDYHSHWTNYVKEYLDVENITGIPHAIDGTFLFRNMLTIAPDPPAYTQNDLRGIRTMVRLWTNFAITGKPHPLWEKVEDPDNLNYLHIDRHLKMKTRPFDKRMRLWEWIVETVGGGLNFKASELS
ncbi:carboxylic ester hydrolase-like [Euwallacea fornicatus]|uniref:carboxylic ester hydrolase-like n=1 Tax=Euwallacea fornicatus TaxID=995702 RepID=UPI00338E6CBF